jgi:peptidoglycan/LPS O-acetylase OafA/YrhL
MTKRYYRPELDALRFFAFASVFFHHLPFPHSGLWRLRPAGAGGMYLFFMLSSYLIVSILLREKETFGSVSWKAFAIRRVLRIWPLYFLVLFGTYFLGHYLPFCHMAGRELFAFSFLLGNVYIIRHGWNGSTIGPLWSLSVEEQFYLAVPVITSLGGRRTLAGLCIAVLLFAYTALAWLGHKGVAAEPTVWVNSFVQFQFFAVGGLIALRFHNTRFGLPLAFRCTMALGGIAFWLVGAIKFHLTSPHPITPLQLLVGYFLVMVGTTLIFLSILDLGRPIPAPIRYLGKISYGLYLFHMFAVYIVFYPHPYWSSQLVGRHPFTGIVLAFALSVGMASTSYHFFERPILKFKERFETIHTRPA